MEVVGCGYPAQASEVQVAIVETGDGSSQVAGALPEDQVRPVKNRTFAHTHTRTANHRQ